MASPPPNNAEAVDWPDNGRPRVLVVGGRPIERDGLAALLSRDGLCVGAVATARAACDVLALDRVGACVLDTRAGFGALDRVREAWPDGPVVLIVTDASAAHDALAKGALGAVRWDDPTAAVGDAVRAALAGEGFIADALVRELASALRRNKARPLSSRERDVLALYGAGLDRRQIAESLSLSLETVATHRKKLLAKLGLRSTTDLVRYAERHGFSPSEP